MKINGIKKACSETKCTISGLVTHIIYDGLKKELYCQTVTPSTYAQWAENDTFVCTATRPMTMAEIAEEARIALAMREA